VSLALAVSLVAPAGAQPPPIFRADTQLVVLDVVARDKKGQTVRDLRPEEFEVFEDGAPRPIKAFRFVAAAPAPLAAAATGAAAPAPPPPESIPNPTLITLVFDALDSEGRLFARQAALELLTLEERPDVVLSVFVVGHRLRLLQQFTNDRTALRAAVERACSMIDPGSPTPDAAAIDSASATADKAADDALAAEASAGAGPSAAACSAAGRSPAERRNDGAAPRRFQSTARIRSRPARR